MTKRHVDEVYSMSNSDDKQPAFTTSDPIAISPLALNSAVVNLDNDCYTQLNGPQAQITSSNNNNFPCDSNKKLKVEDSALSFANEMASEAVTNFNGGSLNGNGPSPPLSTTLNSPGLATSIDNSSPSNTGVTPQKSGAPSKVVHIRNIPNEANESDLINLGLPFGRITNLLLLKGKNQAFVEFADIAAAQAMVGYWTLNGLHMQPTVRGRHVFCQYSNHQQLKQNQPTHTNGGGLNGQPGPEHHMQGALGNGLIASNGQTSPSVGGETAVLRVVVDALVYAVTLDTFHSLFSRFGKITKIVTFNKNNTLQALIQYDAPYSAQSAKTSLDGQAMFGGNSNILRVDFSKLSNLNVKFNNDKSRDYTNNMLPHGSTMPSFVQGGVSDMGHHLGIDAATLAALSHGGALGFNAQAQLGAHLGQSHYLSGAPNGGAAGHRPQHPGNNPLMNNGSMAVAQHAMLNYGTVLLVSNLAEQVASPDALMTLFGVYGDVMRVKVLFNKKDNALVQMAEPQQAGLALTYLDKLKLYGKQMRVTSSKHAIVQLPKEGQPDSGLTKDFSNSPLHRFKKPGSKNYSNIYPPSATLHLSNIPPSISEEQLKSLFEKELDEGTQVVNFKFFPKDRKMALIQLPTIEDAVAALLKMHNYQLGESSHLRVSFSKSSI